MLARFGEDVTVAVPLNTERANALVTATSIEERVERLLFDPGAGERSVLRRRADPVCGGL